MPGELPSRGNENWNFFPLEERDDSVHIINGEEGNKYEVAVIVSEQEGWGICMSPEKARKLAEMLTTVANMAESGTLCRGGSA